MSRRTPNQFQTAEFLKLQAEWDKKLAKSGFDDIEDRATGELAGNKHKLSLESIAESMADADDGGEAQGACSDPIGSAIHVLVTDQGRPGQHGCGPGPKATADYYRLAGHFLWDHQWNNSTKGDRAIWELHCEGLSYREVAKKLNRKPSTVYKRLQALKKMAKLDRLEDREKKS